MPFNAEQKREWYQANKANILQQWESLVLLTPLLLMACGRGVSAELKRAKSSLVTWHASGIDAGTCI